VIGRFPWDPFPPEEADPGGDDPLLARLYRAAVEGGDAYRAVRSAVRRDQGTLRVGNRFVPDGRYREVAFVALGRAASSMALAALHVFGDRLTQGFVAGTEAPPASVPFRSETVPDGWGGDAAAPRVLEATREIAAGLRESDLLLLLVSPGAIRSLLLPPPGLEGDGFTALLRTVHEHGGTSQEVGRLARVLGSGGVGGGLLPDTTAADVQCLLVDRGDGPLLVGGGPTFPVSDEEREGVRATLERTGLLDTLPVAARARLGAAPTPPASHRRPVVVAGPAEALRAAGDAAFDKGWTARVGAIGLAGDPRGAADRFLETVEGVVTAEALGDNARTKGRLVLATTTLDVPEGVSEEAACVAFLARAGAGLRRREMSVGVFRTAGPVGPARAFGGAVVGRPLDPGSTVPPQVPRPLRMRAGITDVGVLAAAVVPVPAAVAGSAVRRRGGSAGAA
jgi:glycerate-2-kinase